MRYEWQDGAGLVTRMLRIWQAARSIGENPLPRMSEVASPLVPAPEFTTACDSLFALTEAVLGRSLAPARCCSHLLSRDEAAVLSVLAYAPRADDMDTIMAVPHGLPAALRWAAFAVVRALGSKFEKAASEEALGMRPAQCPFDVATESPVQLGWAA